MTVPKDATNCLSIRQMAKLLRKISIKDNDIVLVRQSKFNQNEVLEALRKGVERLDIGRVFVIMVQDFEDFRNFNRQEMNAHGWYHIDQINKITDRIKDK